MKITKKCHVKSGDFVYISTGDYSNKIGKILSVEKKKSKALVILQNDSLKTFFISTSNLYLFDNSLSVYSRIGYKISTEKKERYFKKLRLAK